MRRRKRPGEHLVQVKVRQCVCDRCSFDRRTIRRQTSGRRLKYFGKFASSPILVEKTEFIRASSIFCETAAAEWSGSDYDSI